MRLLDRVRYTPAQARKARCLCSASLTVSPVRVFLVGLGLVERAGVGLLVPYPRVGFLDYPGR